MTTTIKSVLAPIRIDGDKLRDLDRIMVEAYTAMAKARKRMLAKETKRLREEEYDGSPLRSPEVVASDVARWKLRHPEPELTLTLTVKGKEEKIAVESFAKAIRSDFLDEATVEDFYYSVVRDHRAAYVRYRPYPWSQLDIDVHSELRQELPQLAEDLRVWAKPLHGQHWLRTWASLKGFHWFALGMLAFSLLVITADRPDERAKNWYQAQAKEILDAGVSSENEHQAIQLLLWMSADLAPRKIVEDVPKSRFGAGFYGFILVLGLFLHFGAPTPFIVAVGKGEKRIKQWEWWLGVVKPASIGLFILGTGLVVIQSWVTDLLKWW